MFHLLSALSLLLAVSALPNPSPTPTRVLAQRQEPSLQASLTYASNNPAATTNRQANPSISPELTQQLAVAATVGDRFKIIYDQGPDYWKFDFLPNVSDGLCFFTDSTFGIPGERADGEGSVESLWRLDAWSRRRGGSCQQEKLSNVSDAFGVKPFSRVLR